MRNLIEVEVFARLCVGLFLDPSICKRFFDGISSANHRVCTGCTSNFLAFATLYIGACANSRFPRIVLLARFFIKLDINVYVTTFKVHFEVKSIYKASLCCCSAIALLRPTIISTVPPVQIKHRNIALTAPATDANMNVGSESELTYSVLGLVAKLVRTTALTSLVSVWGAEVGTGLGAPEGGRV